MLYFNCILCLDKCMENSNKHQQLENKFFALINYLTSCSVKGDIKHVPESSATLCMECQNLFQTFTDRLKLLEIAKLKVDSCVRQIRDVMMEGNDFESNEDMKIGDFRGYLLLKTKLHLESTEPTVKLRRDQFITSHLVASADAGTLEPKLEFKAEPEPVGEMDDLHSEMELGVEQFVPMKSDLVLLPEESVAMDNLEPSTKSDWECCLCDNPPTRDPYLYYSIKCVLAQSTPNKIPHFMCATCKRKMEISTVHSNHKLCPKCGEAGAWRPEDLRKLCIPQCLIQVLQMECNIQKHQTHEDITSFTEEGVAQRRLVLKLMNKLEEKESTDVGLENVELEREISEYLAKDRASSMNLEDDALLKAFTCVNEQEQEWSAHVNLAILQKLKSLKAERLNWIRTKKPVTRKECNYCYKIFENKHRRLTHLLNEHQHRSVKYTYCDKPGCIYFSPRPSDVRRHQKARKKGVCPKKKVRRNERGEIIHQCRFCPRTMKVPSKVRRHERSYHAKDLEKLSYSNKDLLN